jgi:hypothetical protein
MTINTEKKWTAAEIKAKLLADDKWLYHGIKALYARQTDQEKNNGVTQEDNSVGFNGPDSIRMSRHARTLAKIGVLLWEDKMDARKRMLKYAGQLAKIANKRI